MTKALSIVLTDGTVYENATIRAGLNQKDKDYIVLKDWSGEGVDTYIYKSQIREINVKASELKW